MQRCFRQGDHSWDLASQIWSPFHIFRRRTTYNRRAFVFYLRWDALQYESRPRRCILSLLCSWVDWRTVSGEM